MWNRYIKFIRNQGLDFIQSIGLLSLVIFFFFQSFLAFFICSPILIPMMKMLRNKRESKQKQELNYQFKDMLCSLTGLLNAGYSFENGIRLLEKDLLQLYSHQNMEILKYIKTMKKQLDLNIPMEEVLQQFSNSTGLENVENFVNTVMICRKVGGDIIKVAKSAAKTIAENIETAREIETMIAGKRFELKVMIAFPFITILFMKVTSSDFIEPLYNTTLGRLVMLISLLLLLASIYIGSKILEIEV